MYKKILFFLTLGLFAAGCTGGVSDFCSIEYDGTRTIQQDRDCLTVIRADYEALQADIEYVLADPEPVLSAVYPEVDWSTILQPVNPN